MIRPTEDQQYYELTSPTALPKASGFLWNNQMMIHMNCRGYAVAQFMQPEPAKYSYAPNLEAKTFMQPEQPYYAHHPGRFFYLKDEDSGVLYSVPYEPVRATPEPAPVAAAPAGDDSLRSLQQLPEAVRREIPQVAFGGYIYSPTPGESLLLVDKALRREGEQVAPGLVLERLMARAAVMNYRGTRYRVAY